VPTFVDRGVSRGQRGGSLTVVNLSILDRKLETLQNKTNPVGYEVLTAVAMVNVVFWNTAQCDFFVKADVSEKSIFSIFRLEKSTREGKVIGVHSANIFLRLQIFLPRRRHSP
jgi:hypothetical protein